MSAAILKFPEPLVRPDVAKCIAAVEVAEHDPIKLFVVAKAGLALVENMRRDQADDPAAPQHIMNGLTVSLLALAEILGVTDQVGAEL
jgi:hypothetical protein